MLPFVEMADLAAASAELLLSTKMRFIECEAQSFATARPTPDAAPVMSAVAPDRKTAVGDAIVRCCDALVEWKEKSCR